MSCIGYALASDWEQSWIGDGVLCVWAALFAHPGPVIAWNWNLEAQIIIGTRKLEPWSSAPAANMQVICRVAAIVDTEWAGPR
jgi:hypothetical protein